MMADHDKMLSPVRFFPNHERGSANAENKLTQWPVIILMWIKRGVLSASTAVGVGERGEIGYPDRARPLFG
jgi:hypothetical protein